MMKFATEFDARAYAAAALKGGQSATLSNAAPTPPMQYSKEAIAEKLRRRDEILAQVKGNLEQAR